MPPINLDSLVLIRYSAPEVAGLHGILADCGEDMRRRFDLSRWVPPYPIDLMRRDAEEHHLYGVHIGKEAVGMFLVGTQLQTRFNDLIWSHPQHKALFLSKLAVRPVYHGNGIGRWCMQNIEAIARTWSCQAIRFDTLSQHTKLVQFYRNLGYTTRGTHMVTDWSAREWEVVCFEKVLASD